MPYINWFSNISIIITINNNVLMRASTSKCMCSIRNDFNVNTGNNFETYHTETWECTARNKITVWHSIIWHQRHVCWKLLYNFLLIDMWLWMEEFWIIFHSFTRTSSSNISIRKSTFDTRTSHISMHFIWYINWKLNAVYKNSQIPANRL